MSNSILLYVRDILPKGLCVSIGLLFLIVNVHAQVSASGYSWKAASVVSRENNEVVQRANEFVVIPEGPIIWKQNDGAKVYEFEVLKVSGVWSNLQEDGVLTYTVSRAKHTGTLRLQRLRGIYSIDMYFENDGQSIMSYSFNVSSVDKL